MTKKRRLVCVDVDEVSPLLCTDCTGKKRAASAETGKAVPMGKKRTTGDTRAVIAAMLKLKAQDMPDTDDGAMLAKLIEALEAKGVTFPDNPTMAEVLVEAIQFVQAETKRRLEEKAPATQSGLHAEIKELEARISEVAGGRTDELIAGAIEAGTLNPDDPEMMKLAGDLARSSPRRFVKLFASAMPLYGEHARPGGNNRPAAPSSIRDRVDRAFDDRGL